MKLSFRCYRRRFKQPLVTAQEVLAERKGIILRLEKEDGSIGEGEIAPWERFGTESKETAITFLESLKGSFSPQQRTAIPAELPCTRYALSCALSELDGTWQRLPVAWDSLNTVVLIRDKDDFEKRYSAKIRCLKIKIGVNSFAYEANDLKFLFENTLVDTVFRLDANGALDDAAFRSWLEFLAEYRGRTEFLEQPMPVGKESHMKAMASEFGIPVALDESVASLENIKKIEAEGWDGFAVVKPAFIGDIQAFLEWRAKTELKLVYSSAFETSVGLRFARRLAETDGKNNYAVGFGTEAYFAD